MLYFHLSTQFNSGIFIRIINQDISPELFEVFYKICLKPTAFSTDKRTDKISRFHINNGVHVLMKAFPPVESERLYTEYGLSYPLT